MPLVEKAPLCGVLIELLPRGILSATKFWIHLLSWCNQWSSTTEDRVSSMSCFNFEVLHICKDIILNYFIQQLDWYGIIQFLYQFWFTYSFKNIFENVLKKIWLKDSIINIWPSSFICKKIECHIHLTKIANLQIWADLIAITFKFQIFILLLKCQNMLAGFYFKFTFDEKLIHHEGLLE